MMNPSAARASRGELVAPVNPFPLPPTPSLFFPTMDQLESSSFLRSEQLNSSGNMEASLPSLLAPPPIAAATDDYFSRYGHDHDILQFCPPTSHNLTTGKTYNPYMPTPQEYYFPTLLEENMASFVPPPHAQLGINYGGYQTYYFPSRGDQFAYGHRPLRCQVDGCNADLSKAKRYHRRHRVCEHHSKAPVVITAGAIMPQRFCQQCSRFHEVDEFDDAKKSCRRRLADHNRRRRKPKTSSTHVLHKRRPHAKKSATAKDYGSSNKISMGTGDVLRGNASKEHDQSISHGEAARELMDPKGKAPMKQQEYIPQQIQFQQGFPFLLPPGSGTCVSQSQPVSCGSTSNIGQVLEEPCVAFHQHHQHGTILQLGQAVFDLDFHH